MRIAIVDTDLMRSQAGGCQSFLELLAPSLKQRGHEVAVLTARGREVESASRIASAGIPVVDDLGPPRMLPEDRARRLADWCNRGAIDAYLISLSTDAGWLALPFLNRGMQTAAIVQSDGPTFYLPLAHYGDFVDHAVGVSLEICRQIHTRCGISKNRIAHIPYGVRRLTETEVAQRLDGASSTRPLQLAYVGRLVQTLKRVLDLAPLAQELHRRELPFTLHLIGSGEDGEGLRERLVSDGTGDHARWWGWLTPSEVAARLSEVDVLLLPSEVEGLPVALLEAMGHAVVPIVTRIRSGTVDVVRDGENGYLVDVGDIRAFADRVEVLYRDPALRLGLARAAWATSLDYSVERMTSRYEACLSLDAARAPRPSGEFPVMPSCRSRYPRWLRRAKAYGVELLAHARQRAHAPR
jgi:glycosyltransferase involved in cell wall biosynthesis